MTRPERGRCPASVVKERLRRECQTLRARLAGSCDAAYQQYVR